MATTFGTTPAEPSLHFLNPGQEAAAIRAFHQTVELPDSGGPADENLNPAGVTRDIRLVLLGDSNLTRVSTNRAREHPLSVENCHFAQLSIFASNSPR